MKCHFATLSILATLSLTACQQKPLDNETTENALQAPTGNVVADTGLDATDAATGLTYGVENDIKTYLMERLVALPYSAGMRQGRCTSIFSVGVPKIKDVFLQGSTGKVRIAVPITATTPLDSGPNVEPRFYFPYGCYGTPAGGWSTGLTSTGSYDLKIEKWSSGWRPSSEQPPLQPVG
jgi:hypothetical protein